MGRAGEMRAPHMDPGPLSHQAVLCCVTQQTTTFQMAVDYSA